MGGGRGTDTKIHRHTSTHINTMTLPGLGDGPSEKKNFKPFVVRVLTSAIGPRLVNVTVGEVFTSSRKRWQTVQKHVTFKTE